MRLVRTISTAALVFLATAIASSPPAQAGIQLDLTINFIPNEPIIPTDPLLPQQLTGAASFTIQGVPDFVLGFDNITLNADHPTFTGHIPGEPVIPGNPIIPGNPVFQFSFLGSTDGFTTVAFPDDVLHDPPINGPPIIPLDFSSLVSAQAPLIFQGEIVAFDAPVTVGNWNITLETVADVPEPSTWAMMILGFAGVGFMAYRKRRAALPSPPPPDLTSQALTAF
jgi:hypothetical protein